MKILSYDFILQLIGFLIFIIPLKDLILKKSNPWYNRISGMGYFLILIGIGTIIFTNLKDAQIVREKREEKDTLLKQMSYTFDTALKKYGKTYDPKTNTIHDTQSVFIGLKANENKELKSPTLNISNISSNVIGDTIRIRADIKNVGTAQAVNVTDNLILLCKDKGNMFVYIKNNRASTPLTIFDAGEGKTLQVDFYQSKKILTDTMFTFFKISYFDKITRSKKDIRSMYCITTYGVLNNISEINSNEYESMKSLLIKKSLW